MRQPSLRGPGTIGICSGSIGRASGRPDSGLSGLGLGEPQKRTAVENVSHKGPSGRAGTYSTCDLWDWETACGVCGQLNDLRSLLHPSIGS